MSHVNLFLDANLVNERFSRAFWGEISWVIRVVQHPNPTGVCLGSMAWDRCLSFSYNYAEFERKAHVSDSAVPFVTLMNTSTAHVRLWHTIRNATNEENFTTCFNDFPFITIISTQRNAANSAFDDVFTEIILAALLHSLQLLFVVNYWIVVGYWWY